MKLIFLYFNSFQYIYITHLEFDFCRFSNVVLQFSWFRPPPILCHSTFFEGEPPPPRSTPWEAYRPAISYNAIPLYHLALQCSTHSHTHSWQIEVWWLGMFWWTTHVLCTSHIDMTAHTPSLFMSWGALWEPFVCSYDISHSRTWQVSITSLAATSVSQMVTHPSSNQGQSCLTSVLRLQMVTPCQQESYKPEIHNYLVAHIRIVKEWSLTIESSSKAIDPMAFLTDFVKWATQYI